MPKTIEKISNPQYKHQHLLNTAIKLAEQGEILEAAKNLYEAWLSSSREVTSLFEKKTTINAPPSNLETKATDDSALFKIGLCYLFGVGTSQSDSKAEEYFNGAATQDVTEAKICLAHLYQQNRAGLDLPDQAARNKKAAEWLDKAGQQGYTKAQNDLGCMYYEREVGLDLTETERNKKAENWFEKAALQTYARAQYNLGLMYLDGDAGLDLTEEERNKQAAKWLEKAAQQGKTLAQYTLGLMYLDGIAGIHLTEADRNKQAAEWFEKAAQQGHALAQNNLGNMYYKGFIGLDLNVTVRNKQAAKWFKKATQQGNALAQYNLGHMYYEGLYGLYLTEEERNKQAAYWLEKAALQGDALAQNDLGCMYYDGLTGLELTETECNKKAENWFEKAALQTYARAQYNLGLMYLDGDAGLDLTEEERNIQAAKWLEKAAQQGTTLAQYTLGLMYLDGIAGIHLTEADRNKQAAEWFKKAAQQGDALAQYNLGHMYYEELYGLYLTEEERNKQAAYWFRCAAVQGDSIARTQLEAMDRSVSKNYHFSIINNDYLKLASILLQEHGWDLFLQFDKENLDSNEQLKAVFLQVEKELSKKRLATQYEKCICYELKVILLCAGPINIAQAKEIDFKMLSEEAKEQFIINLFNYYVEHDNSSSQAKDLLMSLYDNYKGLFPESLHTIIACVAVSYLGNSYQVTPNITQISKDEMSLIVCLASLDRGSDIFSFQQEFITSKLLEKEIIIKKEARASQQLSLEKTMVEEDIEFKKQRRNYMEFLFTNKHLKYFEDIFSTEKDKVFTLKTLSELRLSKDNFINKIKIAATSQSRKSQLQTSKVVSFSRGINTRATAAKSIEVELNKLLTMPSSSTGIRMRI